MKVFWNNLTFVALLSFSVESRTAKGPMNIFNLIVNSTQGMYPKLTSQDGIAGKGKMTSASRGSRCMQKVIMEDAIEYQERLQCTMVSEQSCSITFKTVFKAKTVNECQEYFKKTCIIEFEPVVHYKRVQFCRDFPIHQCSQSNQIEGGSGNDTCIEDHIVIDVPQETCTLLPLERCGPATKVLPSLQAQEHCINTPKEICQPASLMPKRRIKLPRVRRWCEDRRA
eukprot:TCALIF_13446-PA protein Name:"Protein of unknown function" AED:0.10 eAED:0.10 QI:142/0.75/0.8/1/0.75/0.8/5/53/225